MTPDEGLIYRGVYGDTCRLIEIADFSLARGRDYARHAGVTRDELIAAVTRRGVDPGLIELAVDDAMAKRQPRW